MVGVPEKENTGPAEAIFDQKTKTLTKKKREMQGLERTTCQYRKTRPETCSGEDDEAARIGPVNFRRLEGDAWPSHAEVGTRLWRRVTARGRDFGHATSKGELRSSRCTQPWVHREKWWPETAAANGRRRRRTAADTSRRTSSDTNLNLNVVWKNVTHTKIFIAF